MRWLGSLALAFTLGACAGPPPSGAVSYVVAGDAVEQPLAPPGDPGRGREIVLGRDGNCLLCHAVPDGGKRFMGNLAPPLDGVGSRLSAGQLRLRIVDSTRLNPETIMPSYFRTEGLTQVAAAWRGKPLLSAQQVEDTVAYLRTLR